MLDLRLFFLQCVSMIATHRMSVRTAQCPNRAPRSMIVLWVGRTSSCFAAVFGPYPTIAPTAPWLSRPRRVGPSSDWIAAIWHAFRVLGQTTVVPWRNLLHVQEGVFHFGPDRRLAFSTCASRLPGANFRRCPGFSDRVEDSATCHATASPRFSARFCTPTYPASPHTRASSPCSSRCACVTCARWPASLQSCAVAASAPMCSFIPK